MPKAYIGIASNRDSQRNIHNALSLIDAQYIRTATSNHFQSHAIDGHSDDYTNCVIAIRTTQQPSALIASLKKIEQNLDRADDTPGTCTIDLDLLLYDDVVEKTTSYALPHPDLELYHHVLQPLCELIGKEKHPVLNCSYDEIKTQLYTRNT